MSDDYMKKWSAANDAIQKKVEVALAKKNQKPSVIYSAYKSDKDGIPLDNLDEIAVMGKVIIVENADDFFGNGNGYQSTVINNPTWLDLTLLANEMILIVGDFHHIYFEDVRPMDSEGEVKLYKFVMGS